MRTMFDLFQRAAADYNENIWILHNDPATVEVIGAGLIHSLCFDLIARLATIQECAETTFTDFFYSKDKEGYICKIYSRTEHTACAVEYDREAQKFVPIPYDPWKSLDN